MGAVFSFFECKQADQTKEVDKTGQVEQSNTINLDKETPQPIDGDVKQATDDKLLPLDGANQEQTDQTETDQTNQTDQTKQTETDQTEQQESPSDDEFTDMLNGINTPDDGVLVKNAYKLSEQQIQKLDERLAELSAVKGGRYQRKRNSKKRTKTGNIKKSNRRCRY
jgi:hypothetical protein